MLAQANARDDDVTDEEAKEMGIILGSIAGVIVILILVYVIYNRRISRQSDRYWVEVNQERAEQER